MSDDDAPQGATTTDDPRDTGESSPPAGDQQESGRTFTQAELDKLIADRLDRERRKFSDYNELKRAAGELAKLRDAEKTETQRLNDQLAEREVELQQLRVEQIRNQAGQAAKLDPDLWEFITASDPDEAAAQAKRLAARTALPEPGKADLRQGSRTPAKTAASPNDLLRGMAGYQ